MNAPSPTPSTPLMPLSQALDLARQQLQAQMPPPDLAARVQAQVQARARAARQAAPFAASTSALASSTSTPARWVWSGAAACALLLVGSVLLMLGDPSSQPPGRPATASGGERMAGFMPLVPEEDWPAGDAPAWLVNTELRRDRLVALGLPFDPGRAGDSVRAELLVRPSGEVLAVRFLQ